MKNRILIIGVVYLCLSLLIGLSALTVIAQTADEWFPLRRVPEYLDDTLTPYLIADQNKTVHAFVSQWVENDPPQMAIVYRQWTLTGGWTTPVDILLPSFGETQVLGALLDHDGMIHLLFRMGEARASNIYYSTAPAVAADRAPSWYTPEMVGTGAVFPASASLSGDGTGNMVIIYIGNNDGNGVYSIHSSNGGQSWTEPKPIYLTLDQKLIPFSLQMTNGQEGQLHAVWNVVDSTGVDKSLHYARFDLSSQLWSEPLALDTRIEAESFFGPSFPSIVDNGKELVVMYNSGNPTAREFVGAGRPVQQVRYSSDGGNTWNDPPGPFPRHQGRSGSHDLVVDSSGIVHALFIQRIEPDSPGKYDPIGGLWHSELRNGGWTEPDLFDLGELSGHDIQTVISQGNVLLITMREDPGAGQDGIWFSFTTLNAPELPILALQTPAAKPTASAVPTTTPQIPTPTPLFNTVVVNQTNSSSGVGDDPAGLLLFGLAPLVLVLSGIVLLSQLLRFRRQ